MAIYLASKESLTNIANKVRTLVGTKDTLNLTEIADNIHNANDEIGHQTDLITDIETTLDSKFTGEDPGEGEADNRIKLTVNVPDYSFDTTLTISGTVSGGDGEKRLFINKEEVPIINGEWIKEISIKVISHKLLNSIYIYVEDEKKYFAQQLLYYAYASDADPLKYKYENNILEVPSIIDKKYYSSVAPNIKDYYPNVNQIILGDSITLIYDSSFQDCTELTSINLNNIDAIGGMAFMGCKNLISIGDLQKLNYIGYRSFQDCIALTNIDLSQSSLTDIDDYAFEGCLNLTSISLPPSMKELPYNGFNKCPNLNTIIIASDYMYRKGQFAEDMTPTIWYNQETGESYDFNTDLIPAGIYKTTPPESIQANSNTIITSNLEEV